MNHAPLLSKNLRRTRWLLTAALALLTLLADRAEAQVIQAEGGGTGVTTSGPTEQFRLNAYGILRGGGDLRLRGDGPNGSVDMGPGGGFGARLEIPIHAYIVIGPLFEVQFLRPSDGFGDRDRLSALNFGVWSKGRYVLDLAGNPFEVYVGIPLALAIYIPSWDGADTRVGVSVGAMFGAQIFINDSLGFMLETGFRRDGFRQREDFLGEEFKIRYRTMQFVMNAGISLAF